MNHARFEFSGIFLLLWEIYFDSRIRMCASAIGRVAIGTNEWRRWSRAGLETSTDRAISISAAQLSVGAREPLSSGDKGEGVFHASARLKSEFKHAGAAEFDH
jgi:hypothetical protein